MSAHACTQAGTRPKSLLVGFSLIRTIPPYGRSLVAPGHSVLSQHQTPWDGRSVPMSPSQQRGCWPYVVTVGQGAQGPLSPSRPKRCGSHCLGHMHSFIKWFPGTCYVPEHHVQFTEPGNPLPPPTDSESGRRDWLRSRQSHVLLCSPWQSQSFLKSDQKDSLD